MRYQPSLFESPPPPTPERVGTLRVAERPRAKVLGRASAEWLGCDYTLNPYVGCGFGCAYCYAAAFVADEERKQEWGRWVDVKVDALRELERTDLRGRRVFIGTATDPYQPVEAKVRLTRRILEHLVEITPQPVVAITTRGPLVTRDLDLLRRFESLRVNMSVTTDSDRIRRDFEPSCASIERRIQTLEELRVAGIRIAVFIAPMLPIEDPIGFAQRLKALEAERYMSQPFHQTDVPFRSNTREGAWEVARRYDWDEEGYRQTAIRMKTVLPQMSVRMRGMA
jgi:DNA repair photolyase